MSSLVEVDQYSLAVPEAGPAALEQSAQHRETNLLQLAWSSRWLVLLFTLLGTGIAWGLLQRVTPCYTSVSRIYVDRALPQILTNQMQIGQSASYLYTQAELIRSTSVLAAAVETAEKSNLESFRDVDNRVGFLKSKLTVGVGGKDDIINVAAELPNAKDAAQLVNLVVEAYIAKYGADRKTNTIEIMNILNKEKIRCDEVLESRRKALEEFRREHSSLSIQEGRDNVVVRRFSAVSEKLNETEIALVEAKARYNRIKELYDSPTQRMYLLEMASTQQHAMRDMDLGNQVQQVEQAITSERARWGEGHPRVKLLREQLDDMRERLQKQQQAIIEAYVDGLRQEYELLDHKCSELRIAYATQFKAAADVSTQALELISLEEAVKRAEHDCDVLEDRMKQVNLSEDVGAMNISILEAAGPSSVASYPIRARFFAAGILLGGLTGFGLAWLRDLLDHRLRSVEEIASVLQLPVLGALPFFGDRQDSPHIGQIVAISPRSSAAEAVRTLRTALHFGLAGRDAKTIVVTSPSPGDGKSTVASNLAIAMAQSDQRVLLIDADLRKPTQHEIFGCSPQRGLGSVLTDRRPVEEAIIPGVVDMLDFLPCGPCPSNPVELLNNGFFADLLNRLKERYDRIIIDSPPVMPVADARVIAALGDATVLVLRAERSTRRLSLAARNELWRVRATRIGVVVNGVPMRRQGQYDYGYGHGDGEYGYVTYGYGVEEPGTSRRIKHKVIVAQPDSETVATGNGTS